MPKHIVGIERWYLSKLNPDSAHLDPTLREAAAANGGGALQRFRTLESVIRFDLGSEHWSLDMFGNKDVVLKPLGPPALIEELTRDLTAQSDSGCTNLELLPSISERASILGSFALSRLTEFLAPP
ncbi:hypothetical protein K449DRAFT_430267 [Hypoxylon sp. EC38]|nr:hypothetical protein K449DRAFT_430267 [Hypoxylon sp. EC38]